VIIGEPLADNTLFPRARPAQHSNSPEQANLLIQVEAVPPASD
jgi:hypothetical protein